MAEVFDLGNALQAGDRLKANAQNREFNTLSLSGERQRQDIQQRTFDAEQQRANTEKLLNGIRIARENPSILPAVGQELVAAGILNETEVPAMLERARSNPEEFMRGLEDLESQLMFALGEGQQFNAPKAGIDPATGDPAFGQIDPRTGESRIVQGLTPPAGGGATGSSPSAVREFQFYEGLSPEAKKRFLQVKRASGQIVDINGVPNIVDKESGGTIPLSTPEGEIGAAADKASAVETAKQEAQISAIPEKVQAQFKADFKAGAQSRIRAANDAISRIDSVMEEAQLAIDDIGVTTTGLLGSINRRIAGTTAFALARKIDTIQANLSFDRIAEMRKNSPTGGALGQVSERELSLLGAAVVALDQANNEEEVKRAFTKILFHYNNWKSVLTGQSDADALLREPDLTESTEPQQQGAPTATGPNGERLILQNGQWVSASA